MNIRSLILILGAALGLTFACTGLAFAGPEVSASMTVERFQEIANTPGDSVPLMAPLSKLPFWTNAVISNVMTYASGKVFREVMTGTAYKVQGKYVVFTVQSKFYGQPMHGIVTYDAKASAVKTYALFSDGHGGNRVTESTIVYNFPKKTYSITSEYDDFKESATGAYSDTQDFSKTVVYKGGELFMTREMTTWPAGGK